VSVIDGLIDACGPRHARAAGSADAVAGVLPGWVAAPGDADELAAVLRFCASEGLAVLACGAATKLDWGGPPSHLDVLIDMGRLAGVVAHQPADQIATIGAGTSLRALRGALARAGQRLALDVGSPGATLGGVLATNEAGPLRLAYGTPRELTAGMRVALADGSVVQDIPGHDLPRLFCGSYSTLGVIVEATMRLHAIPAARVWVLRAVATPREVHELTAALLASSFAPVAIEADLPGGPSAGGSRPGELAVLVEGSRATAPARAEAVARILGGGAIVEDTPPVWWGRYPFDVREVALKLVAPSSELFAAIYALRDAAGVAVPVRSSSGIGVAYAALPETMRPSRVDSVLTAARAVLLARGGGSCTVLRAGDEVRAVVDPVGPVPLTGQQRQAKAALDPVGRLAPGRLSDPT
jgi:glycolate oxidase FAD binding subunit